mgnify:CR=1 FL=1
MPLLTFQQQKAIKPINSNNEADYAQIEAETEAVELRKLLGIALLQDVQKHPDTPENTELLDGASFVNCNGQNVDHKGLRYVLAYLAFYRHTVNSGVKDTFTGFQRQDRSETRRLDSGDLKNFQAQFQEIAMSEWEVVKDFLNQNADKYPLWECTNKQSQIYAPSFMSVRKTAR